MNKKISVGVCLSLIAVACAITFVVTWTVSFNKYNEKFSGVSQRDEVASKLQEIEVFIRNNYIGTIDDEKISIGIFGGYISGLGDKNTVYMTAGEYVRFQNEERGKIITGGIIPEKEGSGYIKVAGVYAGSSAETFGIQKGDYITSVEGVNVLEAGADAVIKLLDGEDGTPVNVKIQRGGETFSYPLKRQAIEIISVESVMTSEGVGLIRVSTFNDLSGGQFAEAVKYCVDSEAKALIIDLRQNGSGYYEPLGEMLGGLTEPGAVAFAEYKGGVNRDLVVVNGERTVNLPTVVLVDGATAGAAELMASLLKSGADAHLIGTVTAGRASRQTSQKLKDGSAIRITVARVRTAFGADYNGVGITPDYTVESGSATGYDINDIANTADPQIKKAFEVIGTLIQQ